MRNAHGALVGGRFPPRLPRQAGIPAERIRLGYNVVDNAYFAKETARLRSAEGGGDAWAVVMRWAVSGRRLAVVMR